MDSLLGAISSSKVGTLKANNIGDHRVTFGRNIAIRSTGIDKYESNFESARAADSQLVSRSDFIWRLRMLGGPFITLGTRRNGVTNKEINKFFGKVSPWYRARVNAASRGAFVLARVPSKTGTADSRYLTDAVLIFREAATRGVARPDARNRHTRSSRRRESRGSARDGETPRIRALARSYRRRCPTRESSDESLD